jgi:hypothetical protein
MCSSRRRRIFRLHTGVNRKSCVTGWIGCTTVRVDTIARKPVKGPKGPGHRARRSRGQRKGKRRTRGGKPQRSAPSRPPTSNVPKDRRITNKLRLLDFLSGRFRSFCQWMDRVNERKALLSRDLIYDSKIKDRRQRVWQHPRWVKYRDRWKTLRARARAADVVFAGCYQSSFLEFVQCRYGRFYPETDSLKDLVETMRIDIYKADKGRRKRPSIPKSTRKFPDPLTPRNSRSNTCPDCGRVAFIPALCACHTRERRSKAKRSKR